MANQRRWVIVGRHGLYTGQYLTRKDAIADHIKALSKTWIECKRKGDKCVMATITYRLQNKNQRSWK